MAECKWKTTIEGTIRIVDNPRGKPPCLNDTLSSIKYQIAEGDTEIELRRYAESLFGKYSKKGTYALRKQNDRFGWQDLEITGEELRENMNALIREIKRCWVLGDNCHSQHLDFSRNFWANGDLQLLEHILEKEPSLPVSVKSMLSDLAGVKLGE